jgi:hypothetical protein
MIYFKKTIFFIDFRKGKKANGVDGTDHRREEVDTV